MRTCVRCKIEKKPEEFRGENKSCRACGDKYKCAHGKQKSTCSECSPHLFCKEHGKLILKTNCPECSPHLFCKEHGKGERRVKSKCPECNPLVKCEHGNVRYNCQTCGKKKCPNHPDRYYYTCKDCKGGAFCEQHPDQWKNICKYCENVSGRCEHDKNKKNCVECGGCNVCEHGILKYTCKQCQGTGICEHGRQKAACGICRTGSAFCEHDLYRSACIKCTPQNACIECKYVLVKPTSRCKPYCFACFCVLHPDVELPRKYKIKETHVREYLKEEFKEDIKMIFDKKVADGCSRRRPDVLIDFHTHNVIVECDENQHRGYDCENKRMMELFLDCGNRPIVFIRFNPDSYEECGVKHKGCFTNSDMGLKVSEREFERRMKEVVKAIKTYKDHVPKKEITIEQFFYDKE